MRALRLVIKSRSDKIFTNDKFSKILLDVSEANNRPMRVKSNEKL